MARRVFAVSPCAWILGAAVALAGAAAPSQQQAPAAPKPAVDQKAAPGQKPADAATQASGGQPPSLPPARLPEGAEDAAKRIIAASRASDHAWQLLADLCDRVGPRSAGTPGYSHAVEWALAAMKDAGLENVHRESVTVRGWVRGDEALTVLEPNGPRPLPVTALGRSVGTPAEGVSAPVLVVHDFDELERVKDKAAGKIVVFNFAMKSTPTGGSGYGQSVEYRWSGASRAAKHGAVAVLVRSATTLRARSPHTGSMAYDDGVPKIPAAGISIEDAEMLQRLFDKNVPVTLRLKLGAHETGDVAEANVVGEIRGREHPEEVVVVGGHLDSWDLASGAHDDGAGAVVSIEVGRVLRGLGRAPRRTVRVVLFDNEERGLDGGKAYLEAHRAELAQHEAAIEADSGGFRPTGFGVQGTPAARLSSFLPLFQPLGALEIRPGGGGADISTIMDQGVPGIGLNVEGTHYFDYHHSALDTPDKIEPDDLNDSLAADALLAWLLAESPERLPRVK